MLYCAVLYRIISYYIVLCCVVLCCVVLCCVVLCCAVLCCAVLCCAVLYCVTYIYMCVQDFDLSSDARRIIEDLFGAAPSGRTHFICINNIVH
jgi:uncharacterized membrane protein